MSLVQLSRKGRRKRLDDPLLDFIAWQIHNRDVLRGLKFAHRQRLYPLGGDTLRIEANRQRRQRGE